MKDNIHAIIFDMDGLLIDSEPFWQAAEMEVFQKVGIHLTLEMCLQTTGLRIDEVVQYWYKKQPWKGFSCKEIEQNIMEAVIHQVQINGKAQKGVFETLDFFQQKGLPMAIASSSYSIVIDAVVEKLNLKPYFEFWLSAENEPYGKPHPSVYIHAAQKLDMNPVNCLVFEDSLNGVIAGKAARMKVVAVPEIESSKFAVADCVLDSLEDWNEGLLGQLSKN